MYDFKKKNNNVTKECSWCGKILTKCLGIVSRNIGHRIFCNKSCSTFYKNANKTKGFRISKIEIYFQSQLPIIYPKTFFLFNDRKTINAELDLRSLNCL